TYLITRGAQSAYPLGPAPLPLVARTVVRAEIHLALHRLDHGRMGMAQQHGAVAAEIIDIFVAVDVPLARALGAGDVDGIGVEIARIVRNAAGKALAGALEQGPRAGSAGSVVGHNGGIRGGIGLLNSHTSPHLTNDPPSQASLA